MFLIEYIWVFLGNTSTLKASHCNQVIEKMIQTGVVIETDCDLQYMSTCFSFSGDGNNTEEQINNHLSFSSIHILWFIYIWMYFYSCQCISVGEWKNYWAPDLLEELCDTSIRWWGGDLAVDGLNPSISKKSIPWLGASTANCRDDNQEWNVSNGAFVWCFNDISLVFSSINESVFPASNESHYQILVCSSVEFLNLNLCCLLDKPWLHLGPHSHHAFSCFILKTQWIVSQTSRLVLFLLVLVIFSCPALRRVMPLCRRHLTLNSFYCFHKFCMIHISSWLSPTSLWYSISPCATWLALSANTLNHAASVSYTETQCKSEVAVGSRGPRGGRPRGSIIS